MLKDLDRLVKQTKLGKRIKNTQRGLRLMHMMRSILSVLLAIFLLAILALALVMLVINRSNGQITTSMGEQRNYILYVPNSYNPATPSPLVISLHGYMDWPAHQQKMTGWNALADENGFIVVYPSGMEFPKRWRAYETGVPDPDVIFISELIDKLEAEYNIDPMRIYANGLSNGAGMAFRLSCDLPEHIAAVGLVAGAYLLPWEACQGERPVPAMIFHGTTDPIVPFEGGPSDSFDVPFPKILNWVDTLAQRNGCQGVTSLPKSGVVSGVQYTGCLADVTFYTIKGGGHTWPSGEPMPESITGITTQDIDATEILWEFFQAHPLH